MEKVAHNNKRAKLLSGYVLLLLLVFFSLPAHANDVRHILVLHSYHSGMSWISNIEKGIRETLLVPPYQNMVLHIEYMDTKRYHSAEHFATIKKNLKTKFKNIKMSLILSTDNNAYDFLLKNRDDLFPMHALISDNR